MAVKNTLGDLNNFLFEQLERLNDMDVNDPDSDKEIKRADEVTKVANAIINNGRLVKDVMKLNMDYGAEEATPRMLTDGSR